MSRINEDYVGGTDYECWQAAKFEVGEWHQVNLILPRKVISIETRGRKDQYEEWVKSYKIMYSLDGINFEYYNNGEILKGNSDRDTSVIH